MTASTDARPVALVDGLQTLADRYDLILCDVWGVLHDGLVAFPPASDALMQFRARGGQVVLVSNAPRPGSSVAGQLDKLGVPRAAYDAIITSGDLTRSAVLERMDRVVHHLGPPRDLPIYEGLDVRFGPIDRADYVVCSGFDDDDDETVEDYRSRLEAMSSRKLWMVCANPDLVVERGDKLVPCAGALALAYEEMGGEVYYAGKPHRPIYDEALKIAAQISGRDAVAPERVLAVGDAIRTDIAGASALGVDSLLVARGIHAVELGVHAGPLMSQHVQDWVAMQAAKPSAVTDTLVWTA
jgi:HAD superfamily hydrolase (TIGR01459 family)